MKISFRVVINDDEHFGPIATTLIVPSLMERCFEPVDVCDEPLMALIVGGKMDAEFKEISRLRDSAAEELAHDLSEIILDHMRARDTKNGYHRELNNDK